MIGIFDDFSFFKGTKFQFKCVVMEGEQLKRWETLPNDANRRYKARYQTVTLKGTENKVEGREIVEKAENAEKLAQKVMEKIESEKKSDDMSMSLHLDGKQNKIILNVLSISF